MIQWIAKINLSLKTSNWKKIYMGIGDTIMCLLFRALCDETLYTWMHGAAHSHMDFLSEAGVDGFDGFIGRFYYANNVRASTM